VKVLSRVFRGKFVAGLRKLYALRQLDFHGSLVSLEVPQAFQAMLRSLFRSDWVVYSKRPFGGPQHVLHYLGRYTHRVAISNHRLVSLDAGQVTFRWRDSAHKNKPRLLTLTVDEFLRRFLLHLLPPGFVRIRYFGMFAHRHRSLILPLCFQLLTTSSVPWPTSLDTVRPLWCCPNCGGSMVVLERLSSINLRLRSPPVIGSQHQ
jgi:hypothetical protein